MRVGYTRRELSCKVQKYLIGQDWKLEKSLLRAAWINNVRGERPRGTRTARNDGAVKYGVSSRIVSHVDFDSAGTTYLRVLYHGHRLQERVSAEFD